MTSRQEQRAGLQRSRSRGAESQSAGSAGVPEHAYQRKLWIRLVLTTTIITLAVSYRLFITAERTGNYEGMWFSMLHTVLVAAGALVALRPRVKDW